MGGSHFIQLSYADEVHLDTGNVQDIPQDQCLATFAVTQSESNTTDP